MTKPIARDPIYRIRVFDADIIELCVRGGTSANSDWPQCNAVGGPRGRPLADFTRRIDEVGHDRECLARQSNLLHQQPPGHQRLRDASEAYAQHSA
jgi:hypothetical protein